MWFWFLIKRVSTIVCILFALGCIYSNQPEWAQVLLLLAIFIKMTDAPKKRYSDSGVELTVE